MSWVRTIDLAQKWKMKSMHLRCQIWKPIVLASRLPSFSRNRSLLFVGKRTDCCKQLSHWYERRIGDRLQRFFGFDFLLLLAFYFDHGLCHSWENWEEPHCIDRWKQHKLVAKAPQDLQNLLEPSKVKQVELMIDLCEVARGEQIDHCGVFLSTHLYLTTHGQPKLLLIE